MNLHNKPTHESSNQNISQKGKNVIKIGNKNKSLIKTEIQDLELLWHD